MLVVSPPFMSKLRHQHGFIGNWIFFAIFTCHIPLLEVVGGGHDQIHQILILQRQKVSHCGQEDAATPSDKRVKADRASADGVGDIFRRR